MKRAQKNQIFYLLFGPIATVIHFLCLAHNAGSQTSITVTGNWYYSLPSSSITEAGNNFAGVYESDASQVLISVTRPNNSNFFWRVDVRKSDVDWNANLQLFARRTGNGTPLSGNDAPDGGTSYMLLTNNNQLFFTGHKSWINIPIQYKITGVSVTLPAKTYSTTVIYTVTDI